MHGQAGSTKTQNGLGVAKHTWLTKVGFAVCLVRSTIYVYDAVKVVSALLVSVCTCM